MFRDMLKSKQLLSDEETRAILVRGSNGVLACLGDEDYPYAVPVNYVFFNQRIYFHSAKAGHKIDALVKHPRVSFAVVDEDRIVSAEYTSYFRSAVAFGQARMVEGHERELAFRALVEKYSSTEPEESKQKILNRCQHACIVAIDIEHLTGKQAIELVPASGK